MRERLNFRVDVRWSKIGGWETIAAFNVEKAAANYASECFAVNWKNGLVYRVRGPRGRVLRLYTGKEE